MLSTSVNIGDIFVMNAAKSLRVILRKGLETFVNPGYSGDTYFQTGTIGYRVEERLTLGAIRRLGWCTLPPRVVANVRTKSSNPGNYNIDHGLAFLAEHPLRKTVYLCPRNRFLSPGKGGR